MTLGHVVCASDMWKKNKTGFRLVSLFGVVSPNPVSVGLCVFTARAHIRQQQQQKQEEKKEFIKNFFWLLYIS